MEPTHVYTLDELRDYRLSRLPVDAWLDATLAMCGGRMIDVAPRSCESLMHELGSLTLDEAYVRAGALVEAWLKANREEKSVLESLRLAIVSRKLDLVEAL